MTQTPPDPEHSAPATARPGKEPARALRRPPSVTATWINWLALLSLFGAIFLLRHFNVFDPVVLVVTVMVAIAVPVVLLEGLYFGRFRRFRYRRDPLAERLKRVAIKLLGLATSILLLLATYWIYPYFAEGSSSDVYMLFERIWIPLAILTPIYFWYVDGLMEDPEDDYHAAGLFVLGLLSRQDRPKVWNYIRASFVKIFFYQYILSVTLDYLAGMTTYDVAAVVASDAYGFIDVFIDTVWLVDVSFACTGYFMTFRLFDSHIRTAEPTVFGWLVCLICYGTFYDMLSNSFLDYEDGLFWGHWLADGSLLKALWAAAIVVFLATYGLGTVQFGVRFSNLTHRGIITNGPFRLTKHPQYISKNIAWWLISVPFISASGPEEAIRHCLMLVGFNVIFYYRAKTEERHLAWDPVYIEYAEWIAQHGVIARLRRLAGLSTPAYKVPLSPLPGFYRQHAPGE